MFRRINISNTRKKYVFRIAVLIFIFSIIFVKLSYRERKVHYQNVTKSAIISVDANKIEREIPSSLLGINIEWIYNGKDVWNTTINKPNPLFVSLLKDLKIKIIRYPGGTLSDFHPWIKGIGPNREPVLNVYSNKKEVINFGTDEFVQFSREIGAQPLITVNVGTGTPEEAAKWVDYANNPYNALRIAYGHSEPYKIKYWEIGNELYMKKGEINQGISIKPQEYAEKVIQYSREMKKIDPSIKIAAIGVKDTGNFALGDYPNWNEIVLKKAGNHIDLLTLHNAYAPLDITKRDNTEALAMAALAYPNHFVENIKLQSKEVSKFANQNKEIKFGITEYAPSFGLFNKKQVQLGTSLAAGLYTGAIMQSFISSEKVQIANFLPAIDPYFYGLINWWPNKSKKPFKTASYFALKMYADYLNPLLVNSKVISASYDSPSAGIVPKQKNVAYLQVIATKDKESKTLTFFIVNKHPYKDLNTKIDINNFKTVRGQAYTLNAKTMFNTNLPENNTVNITSRTVKVGSQFYYTVAKHSLTVIKIDSEMSE